MRVVLATPWFPASAGYGGEASARLLADTLGRRGIDLTVLAERSDADDPRVRVGPWTAASLGRALAGADVLHAINTAVPGALARAARRAGVPSVLTANSYGPVCLFGDLTFVDGEACPRCTLVGLRRDFATRDPATVLRRVPPLAALARVRLATRGAAAFDRVVALSETSRRRLVAAGLPEERIAVVPNAADASYAPRAAARRNGDPHVLFVGALKHTKGPAVLVRALERLAGRMPRLRATLAGDGPDRPALERRVREAGLTDRVTLPGWLPRSEIEALYDRASVLAFPVLWDEPFGRVVLEAWARGAPVVTTPRGGPGEIVRDGVSGLHAAPGDAADLARVLERVLTDDALAVRLRAGGREALRAYDAGTVIDRLLGVYRAAMEARR